jgi:hypothetical protein
MKYLLIILILVSICYSADGNDVNSLSAAVVAMRQELPQKEKELAEKEYHGNIEDITAQRLQDVNEVYKYAKDMNDIAMRACKKMGIKVESGQAIAKIINIKKQKNELRRNNAEVIKFVAEVIKDPNNLPEPNDPNYVSVVEENNKFLLLVMESCQPW